MNTELPLSNEDIKMEDGPQRNTLTIPELETLTRSSHEWPITVEDDGSGECVEFIGPTECWNQIGMRILWTIPEVPGQCASPDTKSNTMLHLHEPTTFKLCLECRKPLPIREVTACAWTHLYHANNHEGVFREIQLHYDENSRTWDDYGVTCYEFQANLSPTYMEHFRMTFNVKFRKYVIWVNKFEVDHILTIHAIRPDNKLVETLHQRQITKHIFMGNYLASLLADEMGYDMVLNLDKLTEEQLERSPSPDFISVIRLFNELSSGGGSQIPEENVVDIVKWLQNNNETGKKILVSDYCGLGRTGSSMTAYVYANNPNLSFDEAYEYISKKAPGTFCHKGLRDIVTRLYPRD